MIISINLVIIFRVITRSKRLYYKTFLLRLYVHVCVCLDKISWCVRRHQIWQISNKHTGLLPRVISYLILSSIVCTFFIENDAEILRVHYTWKVVHTNLIHKHVFRWNCKMKVHYTCMHTILDKNMVQIKIFYTARLGPNMQVEYNLYV